MIHEFIRAQNVPNDTVKDQPKHCGVCVCSLLIQEVFQIAFSHFSIHLNLVHYPQICVCVCGSQLSTVVKRFIFSFNSTIKKNVGLNRPTVE